MRTILAGGLCLIATLAPMRAWTDEIAWRPAGASKTDPAATPLVFRPALGTPSPLYRAKADDQFKIEPLPPGPDRSEFPVKEYTQQIPAPATKKKSEMPTPLPAPKIFENSTVPEVVADDASVFPQWFDGTVLENGGVMSGGSCGLYTPMCQSWDCCGANCCDMNCCDMGCCGMGCCDMFGCCEACDSRPSIWINTSSIYWAFKRPDTPPLVTQSFAAVQTPGALNSPGTSVIYGGDTFNTSGHGGVAVNFGFWLPGCLNEWGVDVGFFIVGWRRDDFYADTAGLPVLGQPFTATRVDGIVPVSSIGVNYRSRIWGLDAHVRKKCWSGDNWFVDFLIGYRHIELAERIDINAVPTAGGTTFDQYHARNLFNGPQIGFDVQCKFCRCLFAEGQFRLAAGNVNEVLYINGNSVFTAVNSGTRLERNRFCVVPEVNLKVGVDVCENVRVYVGYNFLYMSDVTRPGEAINRNIVSATAPRPAVLFPTSDFWAQGLNAGVECRY